VVIPKNAAPQSNNNKPTIPTLAKPANNLLCIDSVITFHWNTPTDPDSDAITYQIQVAKDTQFGQITHTLILVTPKNTSGIIHNLKIKDYSAPYFY